MYRLRRDRGTERLGLGLGYGYTWHYLLWIDVIVKIDEFFVQKCHIMKVNIKQMVNWSIHFAPILFRLHSLNREILKLPD